MDNNCVKSYTIFSTHLNHLQANKSVKSWRDGLPQIPHPRDLILVMDQKLDTCPWIGPHHVLILLCVEQQMQTMVST